MNSLPILCKACALALLAIILCPLPAFAHGAPEIMVRGDFKSGRAVTIQIEIDPRCFARDPEHAPYLKKHDLERKSNAERLKYFAQAKKLIAETLRFDLQPSDGAKLDFEYRFQEKPDADSDSTEGTPVVILAEWKAKLSGKLKSYQLEALDAGNFNVYFSNKVDGESQKLNVLFPGEKSYRLDLSGLAKQ